jgi:hypothetical protein
MRIARIDGNHHHWGYIDVDEWVVYGPPTKGRHRWVDIYNHTRMNYIMNAHYDEWHEYFDWLPDN